MRIVSVEKDRRGGKFRVTFDDDHEIILSRDVIIDYSLRKNDEISAEVERKLLNSQSYHDTYFAAMRLLNYKMRTRSELISRLRQKNFGAEVIRTVVDKLCAISLIDDSRYADAFVASRVSARSLGPRELERRLREKGVSKETAHEAVSTVSDDRSQLELAVKAIQPRLRSMSRLDPEKRTIRLIGFLARRGFEWSIIKAAIKATVPGKTDLRKGDGDADGF